MTPTRPSTQCAMSESALPEGDQHENQRNDGQPQMSDGGMLRKQIVGLRFAGNKAGECGKKQHAPRIMAPADKSVIGITSF